MKKVVLIILSFLLLYPCVYAKEDEDETSLINVELVNCMNAKTMWVKQDGKSIRIKLIAYDSSVEDTTEIDDYACSLVENANKIEIEYDIATIDEYNRYPVWVYVDGELLQKKLIKKGYGQVNYILDDYKYLNELCDLESDAIKDNLGIWSKGIEEKYCSSGGVSATSVLEQSSKEDTNNTYNKKALKLIVLFNSMILILLLLVYKRYSYE